MPIDRRQLLKTAALASVGACTPELEGTPIDARNPEPDAWDGDGEADETLFPHGVQSGDPGPDTVLLLTRYLGAASLSVRVHVDGATTEETVEVGEDGFVHHELAGLQADTTHFFQFVDSDGAHSRVGRVRTAIAEDSNATVVLLGASCLHQNRDAYPCLTRALERGPYDAMLWTGDKVYCDGDETLEEFRGTWAKNYVKEDFALIHAHTAGIHTWDDHEHTDGSELYDEGYYHEDIFDNGTRAFYEHCPVRQTEGDVLWRKLRFGTTLELLVLDCRAERDYDAGQYLSPEQLAWLLQALSDSPCTWKGIVNSAPMPGWPLDPLADDRWTGFPADRDALLEHIDGEGITGVIFLGGDYHFGALGRVELEGPGAKLWEAFLGPGGSFLNHAALLLAGNDEDAFAEWFAFAYGFWNTTRMVFSANGLCQLQWLSDSGDIAAEAHLDTEGNLRLLVDQVLEVTDTADTGG